MTAVETVSQGANTTRTPQQIAALQERMKRALLDIVRDNLHTQFASQAASLAVFRDALAAHGGPDRVDDATLLSDFRSRVPLSTYDVYQPFVDKFHAQPCKEEDVRDLLAPGLPDFFAMSSGTSGAAPKLLPKYNYNARMKRPPIPILDPNGKVPLAGMFFTRNKEIKEVEGETGQVVLKIPVCIVTGGMIRRAVGWMVDDESKMSLPGTFYPS